MIVDSCPNCGERERDPVETFAYAEIWTALRELTGAQIPPHVVRSHTPADVTRLCVCRRCGLQYFVPSIPGDGSFYAALQGGDFYRGQRWEFPVVTAAVPQGAELVDVGCGPGVFLRMVSPRCSRALGLDQNPSAVSAVLETGGEARVGDMASLVSRSQGGFDVVCAFHLIEHLATVGELLEPARECLREDGRLFISLPNRDRWWGRSLEPLDCPPHHVSRWSPAQLKDAAARHGFTVTRMAFEEPDLPTARQIVREAVTGWFRPLGAGPARQIGRAAGRLAMSATGHRLAEARRTFTRNGFFGHTMLAELRLTRGP